MIDPETGDPIALDTPNEVSWHMYAPMCACMHACMFRQPLMHMRPAAPASMRACKHPTLTHNGCNTHSHTHARPQYECEDIQGDAGLFEALGVGLGRREMVDVALAAKRLGQDPKLGVATVRCAIHTRTFVARGLYKPQQAGGNGSRTHQVAAHSHRLALRARGRASCASALHSTWLLATAISRCHLSAPRRFFGKFLGTHADYYVFETTLQNPPAEPEEAAEAGELLLAAAMHAERALLFAAWRALETAAAAAAPAHACTPCKQGTCLK